MRRGEIWWANLPDASGSSPGFRRPILVVQDDEFNRSKIQTVIAAVITSNMALASAPGNVAVAKKHSGLPKPSVINVSQIITLDKAALTERAGALPRSLMAAVDDGLRVVLDL